MNIQTTYYRAENSLNRLKFILSKFLSLPHFLNDDLNERHIYKNPTLSHNILCGKRESKRYKFPFNTRSKKLLSKSIKIRNLCYFLVALVFQRVIINREDGESVSFLWFLYDKSFKFLSKYLLSNFIMFKVVCFSSC